MVQAQR